MINALPKSALVLLTTMMLAACGSDSGSNSGGGGAGKAEPRNRVNWPAVPSEFHPHIEEVAFRTQNFEKVNVDAFGFSDDVEVIYSPELPEFSGQLRIYKVWKKSASWGSMNVRPNGTTVELVNQGTYQCSIRIQNSQITELEGGCYVRLQIVLPVGSQLEVYNDGQLISRRFIPINTTTFLDQIDDASFADEKFVVIENFIASYNGMTKVPALTSAQMGTVVDEFMRSEDQFKALSRLHSFVTDRQNLAAMIEREFSYFDREKARIIVGIQ